MSPAAIDTSAGEGVIVQSTTFAICEPTACVPPPLALTLAETEMVSSPVLMAGVTSTSTAASTAVPAVQGATQIASDGILHEMVPPLTGPQDPEPWVTLAEGTDPTTRPEEGTMALKITSDALSGPVFR